MSIWIDRKYASLLAPRLERFSVKNTNPYLANCRCEFCGDSKKSKWKARGYIFEKKGGLFYKCHNCSHSTSIGGLIKHVDPNLYKQYVLERYKEGGHSRQAHANVATVFDFAKPAFKPKSILDELMSPVKGTAAEEYLQERMIPEKIWGSLYFVDNVQKLEQLSDKYKGRIIGEEGRLCIPFYNREGSLVGVTCRALGNERIRYLTVRLNEDEPMIYNLDKVDTNETVYCTEGPIDSMFLSNAVAVGNSDLKVIDRVLPKDKVVLVFDNQPRNKELVKVIDKASEMDYNVCIWPDTIKQKDINEMVLAGMDDVEDIIQQHTYNGLELALMLNKWKKV